VSFCNGHARKGELPLRKQRARMGELPLRRQRCVRASAEAGVRARCCEVPDRCEAGAACVEVPGSSRGSLWSSTRCFFCAFVTSANLVSSSCMASTSCEE
jgi:hypothetical protein